MMRTIKPALVLPTLLLVSTLAMAQAPAEQVDREPTASEKAATVSQLHRELQNKYANTYTEGCHNFGKKNAGKNIRIELNRLDPVLIGRNVVLSREWRFTSFTHEQLAAVRTSADRIYDGFVDFTGRTPYNGTKVLVSIARTGKDATAHAHRHANIICFDGNDLKSYDLNSCNRIMAHELGHTFTFGTKYYVNDATSEPLANLFRAYALEQSDIMDDKNKQKYRKKRYEQMGKINFGSLPPYSKKSYDHSALEFYFFGLVEEVGWEPFKKTFRSYNIGANPTGKIYKSKYRGTAQMNDFLKRVEHFSGKQDVLESLPDKGRYYKAYFKAESITDPQPQRQQNTSRRRRR